MIDRARPRPVLVLVDQDAPRSELHDGICGCCWCVDAREEEIAAAVAERELAAFVRAGRLAAWGIAIGTAIAFAIDAHGAWAALASLATGQ